MARQTGAPPGTLKRKLKLAVKYRWLYLIFLPVLVYFIIFAYGPMYGLQIAFKDYQFKQGIWGSAWVGLAHFEKLFSSSEFLRVLRNTVLLNGMSIVAGVLFPVAFALLLNELNNVRLRKTVQSISYLPYFISWVVLGGIFKELLSPSRGVVNYFITLLGGEPIYFLVDDFWFVVVILVTGIWRGCGWGAIIYIAAISGVDQEMYEAAIIDGANRWQRAMRITLPSIASVISIMTILSVGNILGGGAVGSSAGFDQIFNLYNEAVYSVGDILDTYIYRSGILEAQFSLSTAVGLFKNVVGLVMVLGTNAIVKKLSGEGIF